MTTDRYAALRAALAGVNERSEEIGESAWYIGGDLFYKDSIVNAHVRLDSREGAYIAQCDPETIAALLKERDMFRAALIDVLRTNEAEAKALAAEKVARENFTADGYEIRALERAMVASSEAKARASVILGAFAAQERL